MAQYNVTFWRKATQDDRYGITVEADTPEAAVERVKNHFEGGDELTAEEQNSEYLSKEFVDDSWFDRVEGAELDTSSGE